MQPGLHRAQRDFQRFGDLGEAQAIHKPEQQHLAMRAGQSGNHGGKLVARGIAGRCGRRRLEIIGQIPVVRLDPLRLAPGARVTVTDSAPAS